MRKQLNLKTISWVVLCVVVGAALPVNLTVSRTVSLDSSVFILNRFLLNRDGIKTGDYVIFRLPPNNYVDAKTLETDRLIKRVACAGGETLTVIGRNYYCNGKFIGESKTTTLTGMPVTNFRFNGVVPREYLFCMGDHKDSFDSRYFGFVGRSDIYATAYPVY